MVLCCSQSLDLSAGSPTSAFHGPEWRFTSASSSRVAVIVAQCPPRVPFRLRTHNSPVCECAVSALFFRTSPLTASGRHPVAARRSPSPTDRRILQRRVAPDPRLRWNRPAIRIGQSPFDRGVAATHRGNPPTPFRPVLLIRLEQRSSPPAAGTCSAPRTAAASGSFGVRHPHTAARNGGGRRGGRSRTSATRSINALAELSIDLTLI